MALRNDEVLNRVNTLWENLNNMNIAEIQRNISDRLFWVLGTESGISIDPEILDSVSEAANASNLTNRINTQRWRLSTTPIEIPYNPTHQNIGNTIVTGPTTTPLETEARIHENEWYLNELRDLPNQIRLLRERLESNQTIVNNIHRTQWRLTAARTIDEINNDITDYENYWRIAQDLIDILTRINEIERDRDYWTWSRRWNNLDNQRTNNITRFNDILNNANFPFEILPTWFTVADFVWWSDTASWFLVDYRRINSNITTRLRDLRNEQTWTNNIENLTNTLANDRVNVPDYNLWFTDADTVVDSTTIDTADRSRDELDRIRERLRNLQVLENSIPMLRARYQENINHLNTLMQLQILNERLHPWEINRRNAEFALIRDVSINNLLLRDARYEARLHDQSFRVGDVVAPIPLNIIHWTLWAGLNATYNLCDRTWNPYRVNWWNIEIPLDNWTTIRVSWLTFTPAWEMVVNNLRINPVEWIEFPIALDLNVRVRINNWDWLNIDHHKPLHLEITRPELNNAARLAAYNTLTPPMNNRIQAEYSNNFRENLENEAIWDILREGWNETEINAIYNNETRRNMFIDRVRNLLAGNIPFLNLWALQAWFRNDMTRVDRDVPVQFLLDQVSFQNYLRQNITENLTNYARRQTRNNANIHRNEILQAFTEYQAEISNARVDNLDNMNLLANLPNDAHWPQSHSNNRWQSLTWRTSRHNNYTKFFQWRNANLENLTLETEEWRIKYWVRVEVSWVNRISAIISIDGKEEPEIIDAANHDRLIRWILRRSHTKDWEPLNRKLRCNIALAVLKAMVMMSPQRLNRQIPPQNFVDQRWNTIECDRIEVGINRWNLRVLAGHVDPTTHTRRNVTIFDENQFMSLHNIDLLEEWVFQLSTQINSIMNAMSQEYHYATIWAFRLRNSSLLKYNTKQRLRWGPIKRLWGRLVHWKTNDDFDFETTVNEAWKTANIVFNKWKFTVSWTFEGQEYQFVSKDLWSILRKKINKKRVFDWIELAMVASVNEEYISRLRSNNLIQSDNFAVADLNQNKSWRIYILDETWELSYLEIEERWLNPLGRRNEWRIRSEDIPTERVRCNAQERREFFQNPFLSWRLVRSMRRRLALF